MKRQAYYPSRAADQIVWLENFRNKLTAYQAALGLTAAQVAAGVADARWLVYVLGSWLPAVRAFAPSCTNAANEAQSGTGANPLVLTVFTAPALPAGVVPVAPGALNRIFALVAAIKLLAGYADPIGTDLQIVGAQQAGPDFTTLQPVITATVQAGTVLIGWGWQGFGDFLDLLELQVDRGAGQGWGPLASDTTPNYTDTAPFPATLTKWKYRAIYRVGDAPVGLWSAEVSVTVGG